MKTGKYLLLIGVLMCLWCKKGLGQEKYKFGNAFIFDQTSLDTRFMVRQPSSSRFLNSESESDLKSALLNLSYSSISDTVIFSNGVKHIINYGNEHEIKPKSPIILGVKLNPELTDFYSNVVNSISKSFSCYIINDSSEATLIALGITKENIKDFKYHVVENDSIEIIPWSPIPKLEQKYGAIRPYAAFGSFKAPGKQLMVEIVNTKNYSIRDGVIFDWRVSCKPIVNQIIVSTPRNYFNISYKKLNRDYATKFDMAGLPLDFKFPVDSVRSFRLDFKSHPTIGYNVYLKKETNGKTEIKTIEYELSKSYFILDDQYFKVSGKYELIIQRSGQPLNYYGEENTLRIPFEVLPPISKNLSTKQVIIYGTGVLLLFSAFFIIYYLYNRRKLKKAFQLKEKATLQLKAIRSQLNPHFTFNALNSIQNLMNRNDVEAANHYLARFSSLTRRVLTTGDNDLISLADEITLLDDYLQMEQLRFGFTYTIDVDIALNKENIEIPAMLLQPFVENAVKHGIATLREQGTIKINFAKQGKDLVLSVTDNGTGFNKRDLTTETKGMGLKLSRERIALLNSFYTNQKIDMEIESQSNGTKITVTLGDWI